MAKPITGMLAYIVAGRETRYGSVQLGALVRYYCSNASKHGTFFKSMFDICFYTRLSERFVNKANAALRSQGVLSWVEGNSFKKKANTYTLNLAKMQSFVEPARENAQVALIKKRLMDAARQQRRRDKIVTARRHASSQHGVTASQHGVTFVTVPGACP
jgi:hypothetical protein